MWRRLAAAALVAAGLLVLFVSGLWLGAIIAGVIP